MDNLTAKQELAVISQAVTDLVSNVTAANNEIATQNTTIQQLQAASAANENVPDDVAALITSLNQQATVAVPTAAAEVAANNAATQAAAAPTPEPDAPAAS